MDDWADLVRACHPWSEMFLDDVTGEFRAVLEELLQGDHAPSEYRSARLRRAARAHGAFRRRQGCPSLVLAEEIAFAESAIAAVLMRGGASMAAIAKVQDTLAPVMRAIERATYSGYVDGSERPGN